jgi:pimeloyl-ACP methyl ester carboxylesterase
MTNTVLFVHGAWLTPKAWDGWRSHFEAAGYKTVAPTWPHMDRPIDLLRKAPDPALEKLSVVEIVDHYAAEIAKLDEAPIIIGHSFGGLITMMLLDRGCGVAGAVLDPAPPRGHTRIALGPERPSGAAVLEWLEPSADHVTQGVCNHIRKHPHRRCGGCRL